MPDSLALLPTGLPTAARLLPALLDLLPTGVVYYTPQADAAGEVLDFAFTYLNPAAQRMLGLPAQPTTTFGQHFPESHHDGSLALHREAFRAGEEPTHFKLTYQADGYDNYFQVEARRLEDGLLVSLTDSTDQSRTVVEEALRLSQARERAARIEAEAEHQRFYELLQQLPAQVASYSGSDHVCTFVNQRFTAFIAADAMLGRPVREAARGAVGPELFALLDQVYATGQPAQLRELEVILDHQPRTPLFVNASYYPLRDAQGQINGVLDFSYDVTEQVLARRQVEQLNQELETRVAERTQQLAAALHLAEQQREQVQAQQRLLNQILGQVPAAIATLSSPEHRYTFFNAPYQALSADRAQVGLTVAEVFPEVEEQGFIGLLDQVYATSQPFIGTETLAMLHDRATGQAEQRYVDFIYQPLVDGQQQTQGILAFILDVTDRVRARKQADTLHAAMLAVTKRQAQARQDLYQVFEQTPDAIVLLREFDHRIDYFNPAFEALFPPEEWAGPLQGHVLEQVYPRFKAAGLVARLDDVYRTGESQVVTEIPLAELQPGSPRYVTLSYQAYREQGHTAGVAVFIYDMTEQVLARRNTEALQAEVLASTQRQLQERATFYQVFDQTPALIQLMRGPDHRIAYANDAYQQLFPGRPLVGLTVAEALPELRAQGFATLMDHVYQTGETYFGTELAFTLPGTNGQPARLRYFTFTYQAYHENGQVAGLSLFGFDVTEQVRAQQEREVRQAELQRIFEQAPVAIFVLHGPAQVLTIVNPAMQEVLGPPLAELLGKPYFEAMPELAAQGYADFLAEVWRTGQPFTAQEQPAQLRRHQSGETGYFTFVYQPLHDAQGRVTDIMCVAVEVTEQVTARQQVQALNEELAAINEEVQATNEELNNTNTQLTRTNADLDTFVYSASHDLKSPITNIEGLLMALRQHLPANALAEPLVLRLLDMMSGAVTRFQQTLGHLTDVSRLQQAILNQPAEEIDLPALVEDVRLDILPELTAAGATLTVDLAACPTVRFSPKNLRSIIYNLLSNAVKYCAPGRAPVVQLRGYRHPGQVVLTVHDNGLGLSEEQQGELFRLFRRLHSHVPGSGVGLYMVKKMVENAGGTLAVQSRPGVGSIFTVSLPHAD